MKLRPVHLISEPGEVARYALAPEDLAAMQQEYDAALAAMSEPERAAFLRAAEDRFQRTCDDEWRDVLEADPPEAKA